MGHVNYGLPYMGSKSKIADWVVSHLPSSNVFVDLFAGGCAITHCAMKHNRWSKYIANDITDAPRLFLDAVNGKYKNEDRWIGREDFFRLKDTDPYVRICWSFGNDQFSYMYSPDVERFNKHLHNVFFAGNPHDARLSWKGFVREFVKVKEEIGKLTQTVLSLCSECGVEPICNADGTLDTLKIKDDIFRVKSADFRTYLVDALKKSGKTQKEVDRHLGNQMSGHYFGSSQWLLPTAEQYTKLQEILPDLTKPYSELSESFQSLKSLENLQSLQRLERLENFQSIECLQRLQSLESLQILESLEVSQNDYRSVEIPHGSTVYCDPPYKNTSGYLNDFDHEDFYQWLLSRDFPVFVSEYIMPDGFSVVSETGRLCTFSPSTNNKVTERLFVQEKFKEKISKPTLF